MTQMATMQELTTEQLDSCQAVTDAFANEEDGGE